MHLGTFIYYVFASLQLHMVNADAEKTKMKKPSSSNVILIATGIDEVTNAG